MTLPRDTIECIHKVTISWKYVLYMWTTEYSPRDSCIRAAFAHCGDAQEENERDTATTQGIVYHGIITFHDCIESYTNPLIHEPTLTSLVY